MNKIEFEKYIQYSFSRIEKYELDKIPIRKTYLTYSMIDKLGKQKYVYGGWFLKYSPEDNYIVLGNTNNADILNAIEHKKRSNGDKSYNKFKPVTWSLNLLSSDLNLYRRKDHNDIEQICLYYETEIKKKNKEILKLKNKLSKKK